MTKAIRFSIYGQHVTVCPPIPANVTHLTIENTRLTRLPALPIGLKELYCSFNQLLISLPALPSGLTCLWCFSNQLISLPALPSGLEQIYCGGNALISLPTLPIGLTELNCVRNQLTCLPALPSGLRDIYCTNNPITWCERIKDAERIGLYPHKIAKIYRIVCKMIARKEAVKLIQRNCLHWLEAPVTKDGRLGILLRIGMRYGAGYGTWNGENMWTQTQDGKLGWAGNGVDKEIEYMYPPK